MLRFSINRLFFVLVLGVFCLSINTTETFAQSLGGISLTSIPEIPEPHETVRVSLDQYGVDTFGASISWYINNEEQADFRNERSMEFEAGGLSEKTTVNVAVSKPNSPTLTASKSFSPVLIDMIVEADTYIPSFYKGRALPSKEADIRVATVLNGLPLSSFEYSYKWTLGTQVLFGGPVRGKVVAELQMPRFTGKRLRVEVFDQKGVRVAENSLVLEFYNPELHFYEESLLRGLVGHAIEDEWLMLGEEVTITAAPYYINAPLISGDTHYEWEINGRNAYPEFKTPHKFSFQRQEEPVPLSVSLEMITSKGAPQFVDNRFKLLFQ